jgi:thymidylate kinase
MKIRPVLIEVDGPNGSGKSTLCEAIAAYLGGSGIATDLVNRRGPGSDPRVEAYSSHRDALAASRPASVLRLARLLQRYAIVVEKGCVGIIDRGLPDVISRLIQDGGMTLTDAMVFAGLVIPTDLPALNLRLNIQPELAFDRVLSRGNQFSASEARGMSYLQNRHTALSDVFGVLNTLGRDVATLDAQQSLKELHASAFSHLNAWLKQFA